MDKIVFRYEEAFKNHSSENKDKINKMKIYWELGKNKLLV